MTNQLEITSVIQNRCATLKLSRSDLVRRADYKNIAKGLRRLDALCAGNLEGAGSLIAGLPAALGLPPEIIAGAIAQTEQNIAEERRVAEQAAEAVWRAHFKPCAYLVGTSERPSSICLYGISGGAERWLRIPLDLLQPPVTYAAQAHAFAKDTPTVTFFGPTAGFIVNYTPDYAVRFNVKGVAVEVYDRAYRPEEVILTIGKKPIPPGLLSKMFGRGA